MITFGFIALGVLIIGAAVLIASAILALVADSDLDKALADEEQIKYLREWSQAKKAKVGEWV